LKLAGITKDTKADGGQIEIANVGNRDFSW
jgi:hypothetical protein